MPQMSRKSFCLNVFGGRGLISSPGLLWHVLNDSIRTCWKKEILKSGRIYFGWGLFQKRRSCALRSLKIDVKYLLLFNSGKY